MPLFMGHFYRLAVNFNKIILFTKNSKGFKNQTMLSFVYEEDFI